MRKSLIAAVALAPICLLASQAGAATTVSSNTNAPLKTSTAASGGTAADDLTIGAGVTVSAISTARTIITIDSNNVVTNAGALQAIDLDGSVGVLAQGGRHGSIYNSGSISLGTSASATDRYNSDGIVDWPFAPPASSSACACGYIGVQVVGASPFVGAISNTGSITIKGNQSYGISIEAPLTGDVLNAGTISITGDQSVGIRTLAPVSGIVTSSSTITATGLGAQAINLGGSVGGGITLYGSVTATGYASVNRPSLATTLSKLQSTQADVQQSGGAVVVGGNVGGGIYLGGAPSGTVSGSTADLTGDGVNDGAETTASVVNYGSKPALTIGSTTAPITIGAFVPKAGSPPASGPTYGIVIRGSITGAGVYDGKSATGLQIGGVEDYDSTVLQGVAVTGGVDIVGAVNASSYNANATAMVLGSGSSAPLLQVDGAVSAVQGYSTLSQFANGAVTVTGIKLESGASASTLNVNGAITASVNATNGQVASAYAVRDLSGSINQVLNQGVISALIGRTALSDSITGAAVALDLSANTSGVSFTQRTNPNPNHAYGDTSGSTHTATTTLTAVTPTITGDILLGSGTNTVNLLAGSITGALDMGSGTGGSLVIDGGSTLTGALRFGGGGLAVNVNNGTLDDRNTGTIHVSTLTVGASGSLVFAVDPVNNSATKFIASGPVTFANGAKLGLTLSSAPTGNQSFTLVQTPSLTMGATTTSLLSSTPYLLSASIASDTSAGTVTLNIRRKTATEMGLNAAEGSALNAVYTNAASDAPIQSVLLAPTTKANFLKVYDQMLPDSSGGVFEFAQEASEAISRATAQADEIEAAGGTRELWAQQFFIGLRHDRNAQNVGHDATGFGIVGGVASGGHGYGVVGATAAFTTGTVTLPNQPGDTRTAVSQMETGVYWQGQMGALRADARLGAGFSIFEAKRQLFQSDSNGVVTVNRLVKDDRSAWSLSGHAGLSYQKLLGRGFYLRPYAHGDYFSQNEDGYTENDPSGKTGFALIVKSRSGDALSGTAGLVFGGVFGTDVRYRPEVEFGYRGALSGDAGKTTAAFKNAPSSTFVLAPSDLVSGAVTRVGVKASTDFYEIGFEANGRFGDHYTSGSAQFTVRVLF